MKKIKKQIPRLKYRLKLFLDGECISDQTFHLKTSVRSTAKLVKWHKAYLKITYAGKGDNEVFNDMDCFSYKDLDKKLTDFTEKKLVDYLQS